MIGMTDKNSESQYFQGFKETQSIQFPSSAFFISQKPSIFKGLRDFEKYKNKKYD